MFIFLIKIFDVIMRVGIQISLYKGDKNGT